jgi:DNA repair exonuclease SbcCD nuclease subunit
VLKVLLLADTHLGFDLPAKPRVEKRRRGPDFFANTRLALEPALRGAVDAVVHGGDLLYRSKVPAWLVERALEPLLEVADARVPVLLVPGNHERSALPYPLLASHENLHVLHRPKTVERTSFVEREEAKGYLILELEADGAIGGRLARWVFHELPARPMGAVTVDASGAGPKELERKIRDEFSGLADDAVVQLRVGGTLESGAEEVIRAANLRRLHPPTMTVTLRFRAHRR